MDNIPKMLERLVWSDADFELMNWNKTHIRAFAVLDEEFELIFDIDYVVEWVRPVPPDVYYRFWVAPATLVFEHVWHVKADLMSEQGGFHLQALHRLDEQVTPSGKIKDWLWTLIGDEGTMSFRATGYKQYFRKQPVLVQLSKLNRDERGGISFSRDTAG